MTKKKKEEWKTKSNIVSHPKKKTKKDKLFTSGRFKFNKYQINIVRIQFIKYGFVVWF